MPQLWLSRFAHRPSRPPTSPAFSVIVSLRMMEPSCGQHVSPFFWSSSRCSWLYCCSSQPYSMRNLLRARLPWAERISRAMPRTHGFVAEGHRILLYDHQLEIYLPSVKLDILIDKYLLYSDLKYSYRYGSQTRSIPSRKSI